MGLNNYKDELYNIASDYVKAHEENKNNFDAATRAYNSRPHGKLLDGLSKAKAAEAEANYERAKVADYDFRSTKTSECLKNIDKIHESAKKHIAERFAARPSDIDGPVWELIKNGICTPAELDSFMDSAVSKNNSTMMRLIAQYATSEAEKHRERKDNEKDRAYRLIALKGKGADGSEYTESFGYYVDCIKKIIKNPNIFKNVDIQRMLTESSYGI